MRILIIEDNDELARLVADGLKTAGYVVDRVSTASEARDALAVTRFDAIVLDLGLPDADGLTIVKEVRARRDPIAVLVLTARAGVHDRVEGLRNGADDYLVKPFAFEELLARLEAMLRRPRQLMGISLSLANLAFDTESKQVSVDGEPQLLSAREVAVLEILMRRKGRVVAKKVLEDQLSSFSAEVSPNAVEVYIHRLRKQLAERGAAVQIHTIRGVGYLIGEEK